MASKEFILQGFTEKTHGAAIQELFKIEQIEKVILSIAFISESGVAQVEESLKAHIKKTVVLAGIRNEITSYQGLKRLHTLGTRLYTVDTGSRTVVFHPKLYFVRGKQYARLLIGSANLTLGGINNNIEAGILLQFDFSSKDDLAVVDEIEKLLLSIIKDHPLNVTHVKDENILKGMLASGRLSDEMAIPPPRPSTSNKSTRAEDPIAKIKLKTTRLYSLLKIIKPAKPKVIAGEQAISTIQIDTTPSSGTVSPPALATIGVEFEIVWESKALTRRDLNIPNAENTHVTGSINLDKGLLDTETDHRHYFREDVFSALSWSLSGRSDAVEEAYAKFQLVLKGISYGEYDLRIAHTIGTDSASYKQNNAMTRLSWGPIKEYIAREDLIDRSLCLYRDQADAKRFILEID